MMDLYKVVMDERHNALTKLPKAVQFQVMNTLSYMWCAIFCLGLGTYSLFGTLVIFHMLFIVGLFATSYFFSLAEKNKIMPRESYRDNKDGCARYDDLWGGV